MNTIYKNEQLKRRFYEWLKNSRQYSDDTVRSYEKSIWVWEDFTHNAYFGGFNKTMAGDFKEWLKNKKKANAQENISISYCYDILRFLKVFFDWLSKQAGYKSKITQTDIDYLNLTRKEVKEATQPKNIKNPVLDEIKKVIENIEGKTEIEMRDKALFSLALMTGARITAIRTLSMKCFDKNASVLFQDPALGVETKFSKKITTPLLPFSYKEALNYFIQWFDYLEKEKGFNPDDPIFPATKIENGKDNISYYNTGKVEPKQFQSSTSLRKIFEKRFKQAGVTYYHPHTFRHWWVKEIAKLPLTEEEKKAISQSLGHENVGTTFGSYGYGKIEENRQIEIIKNIDFEGRKIGGKITLDNEQLAFLAKEIAKQK